MNTAFGSDHASFDISGQSIAIRSGLPLVRTGWTTGLKWTTGNLHPLTPTPTAWIACRRPPRSCWATAIIDRRRRSHRGTHHRRDRLRLAAGGPVGGDRVHFHRQGRLCLADGIDPPQGPFRGGDRPGNTCPPWPTGSMLLFIWLCLVYVLVVFADLTAATFVESGPWRRLGALHHAGHRLRRVHLPSENTNLAGVPDLRPGRVRRDLGRPQFPLDASAWPIRNGVHDVLGTRLAGVLFCQRPQLPSGFSSNRAIICPLTCCTPRWPPGSWESCSAACKSAGRLISAGPTPSSAPCSRFCSSPSYAALFRISFAGGLGHLVQQLNEESDARVVGYSAMLIQGLVAVIALKYSHDAGAGRRTGRQAAADRLRQRDRPVPVPVRHPPPHRRQRRPPRPVHLHLDVLGYRHSAGPLHRGEFFNLSEPSPDIWRLWRASSSRRFSSCCRSARRAGNPCPPGRPIWRCFRSHKPVAGRCGVAGGGGLAEAPRAEQPVRVPAHGVRGDDGLVAAAACGPVRTVGHRSDRLDPAGAGRGPDLGSRPGAAGRRAGLDWISCSQENGPVRPAR